MSRVSAKGSLRRFESAPIDPERNVALAPDHPAVVEGRTVYPSTVTSTLESPRFLVSGRNNPKLGAMVTKGERSGWPIYQLTLEERATCPRSCHAWLECYGNGMHLARRHAVDGEFMAALRAEVLTVARSHPEGLLVRLHTLGDFFSVEYVLLWGELLALLPQLHVFGYTARREDDPDPKSQKIAKAIRLLTQGFWSRFAIRTSHTEPGRERSIVIGTADPDLPKVIVCPAQTHATECCGTCGLCWAEGVRDKTIAFMRHGMARRGSAAQVVEGGGQPISHTARWSDHLDKLVAYLGEQPTEDGWTKGLSYQVLGEHLGLSRGSLDRMVRELAAAGRIEVLRGRGRSNSNRYRLVSAPVAAAPPEPPQAPEPPVALEPAPAERPSFDRGAGSSLVTAQTSPFTQTSKGFVAPAGLLSTRILEALTDARLSTISLASLLDVKELYVSQALSQLRHDGLVWVDGAGRQAPWSLVKPAEGR